MEAELLAVLGGVVTASVVVSFVFPFLLQIVIKAAMSKVWSIFNTLQIIFLMPLMALTLPRNVQIFQDEINKIVNLEFIPKDRIYEYIFGTP